MYAKTEAARLDRVRPSHPGSQDAADSARLSSYSTIRYVFDRTNAVSNAPASDQRYEVSGDHIHVLELSSGPIGISLDGGKKFIRVREGDTLKRAFSKVVIRYYGDPVTHDPVNLGAMFTPIIEGCFLVSYGEAITRLQRRSDFAPGFPARRVTATTVGIDLLSEFTISGLTVPGGGSLRGGGTLILKNRDIVNPVFFYYGTPGTWDAAAVQLPNRNYAFEIGPGETLTLEIGGKMLRLARSMATDVAGVYASLCLATDSGTASVNAMLSNWYADRGDEEGQSVIATLGTE